MMPRIPDKFLDCVVYLYPSEAEAEDGKRIGGSGFLVGIPAGILATGSTVHILCVVTNKHVVDSGNMTVRLNTRSGLSDIIPLDR